MSSPVARALWVEGNQRALSAAIGVVRERLLLAAGRGSPTALSTALEVEHGALSAMREPCALDRLVSTLGLTSFERGILVLAAGVELDRGLGAALDLLGGVPTLSVAMAALPEPHWDALAPSAPLRRLALLRGLDGGAATRQPLELEERVLSFLLGVSHLDARLEGLATPLRAPARPAESLRAVAERVVAAWRAAERPLVQLCGLDPSSRLSAFSLAATSVGLNPWVVSAMDLPESPMERMHLQRLWDREALLGGVALLVELDPADPEPLSRRALSLVEALGHPSALSCREALAPRRRVTARLDVARPSPDEQRELWLVALGDRAPTLGDGVERLVAHFDLSPERIVSSVVSAERLDGDEDPFPRLWSACRRQARPELEGLAQRIEARSSWEDLVLPDAQQRTLEEMAVHTRRRLQVTVDWGFGARSSRGLGLTALFAGPSGTGKTLAAEVLAGALDVDLYRIDLSSVMSKYIGETEKNLRRIFDAAEGCGAILLFDEADALFGKRSEVKDSHDRYANIEVSYLLQRMEAYSGLAVLTTNLKDHLDQAFLRRIRFLVQFPFPGREQRREIWRRAIPRATPTEGLDYTRLAQLNIAGGNIRNIAFNAAVLAAEEGRPVGMAHMLRAARSEYAKLDQPLTASEIGGWR